MNWKRLFLILAALLLLGYCIFSVAPILLSVDEEDTYPKEVNSKIPGSSSRVIDRYFSGRGMSSSTGYRIPGGWKLSSPTP